MSYDTDHQTIDLFPVALTTCDEAGHSRKAAGMADRICSAPKDTSGDFRAFAYLTALCKSKKDKPAYVSEASVFKGSWFI